MRRSAKAESRMQKAECCRSAFSVQRSAFDRGAISLLEVLISIGIVAVGLLSIASLLPVGGIQAQKADVEMRKTALGMNLLREFTARGIGRMPPLGGNANDCNWLLYNGADYYSAVIAVGGASLRPPVAIDPEMIAATTGASAIQTFPANIPTGVPTTLPMRRLTIKQACTGTGPYTLSRPLSDAVCVPRDDVVIDQPSDATLPATNYPPDRYTPIAPANPPIARDYAGDYSWLTTITPNDSGTATSTPAAGQTYTLSIVIFYKRAMTTPTVGSGQEEMVEARDPSIIANPPPDLHGGGEIALVDPSTAKLEAARPGQWMMLCRDETTSGAGYRVFKWYRIVSATAVEPATSGGFQRYLTIAGPDWKGLSPAPPAPKTYACLFSDAVAVYERTIRLEEPGSTWSP